MKGLIRKKTREEYQILLTIAQVKIETFLRIDPLYENEIGEYNCVGCSGSCPTKEDYEHFGLCPWYGAEPQGPKITVINTLVADGGQKDPA